MRDAFQNTGLKIGNSYLFLLCRPGNVKSSSTPDKEKSSLRDAVSTNQLANNTLKLDYPPYLFLMHFKELFSRMSVQRPCLPEGQDPIILRFIGLKPIVANKCSVLPHLSNASINHFTK